MRINITESVKIGYKDYKVNTINDHVVSGNEVCYGNVEYDQGIINISSLYSKDQQQCAFIHEVIHAIDDIVEAGLTEDQVRKLGKGLYQFIKDNPELFHN